MSTILAIDFGGTNIRVARFETPIPPPSVQIKRKTLAEEGPDRVIERLKDAIAELMPDDASSVKIGIAAPGPLDPESGIIIQAPNLPGWKDIPLSQDLSTQFGCPVFLGNDANLAALGEWRHGAGVGTDHLVYLTISTGIGGGIISHGRLLTGYRGLAAELGHMSIIPDGPRCGCGIRGHLEAVAAGPAIARNALNRMDSGENTALRALKENGTEITAVEIAEAAKAGDQLSVQLFAEAGQYIGHHLANLAHAFSPELFILGGGVSTIGDLLFDPIRKSFLEHVMDPIYAEITHIVPAALGDDAGLVGALVLADQG